MLADALILLGDSDVAATPIPAVLLLLLPSLLSMRADDSGLAVKTRGPSFLLEGV